MSSLKSEWFKTTTLRIKSCLRFQSYYHTCFRFLYYLIIHILHSFYIFQNKVLANNKLVWQEQHLHDVLAVKHVAFAKSVDRNDDTLLSNRHIQYSNNEAVIATTRTCDIVSLECSNILYQVWCEKHSVSISV